MYTRFKLSKKRLVMIVAKQYPENQQRQVDAEVENV